MNSPDGTHSATSTILPDVDLAYLREGADYFDDYVAREWQFDADCWVTRKGAISARHDELGIIPGSMDAASCIVRGRGNPDSFHSASHGAGRQLSRTAAKKAISLSQHPQAVAGVESE